MVPVVIICYFTWRHAGLHQQLADLWHGPLLCHFITFFALYSVSNQVSEVQVSFINFRLLSSGTPLHTCTLQTLHFTDVLAMAAQGFCTLGNITDLQYMRVFPDVVAVRVSGGCTDGNFVVLTDNTSFVKQA